jgi:Protein of unknown function (DUF3987)
VTTTALALCGYGWPIEPGADRCASCSFAGAGPAPCRFPQQASNGHIRHDSDHQAADPGPPDDDDWDDLMARRERVRRALVAEPEPEDEAELPEAPPFPAGLARGPLADLLNWAELDGLPVSYVAASAETVAAAAAAQTVDGERGARLSLGSTRRIIPALWQALIGDSGEAKNPPIRVARQATEDEQAARLADWQARCDAEREAAKAANREPELPARPEPLYSTSATVESQARWLMRTGGAGLVTNGELASFLRGLGQYKAGGGSDRFDAMDIWSGEPILIQRVGGGGARNAVLIDVPEPRLSVVGGLVTDNLPMLGNESDGLRARFLPVLASSDVIPNFDGSVPLPDSWLTAMRQLHRCENGRDWYLRGEAREAVKAAAARWLARKREGTEPKVIRTALAKADEQCLRIALAVAELSGPGAGGDIPLWCVQYAIARVEYALGVWLALGTDQVMAYNRRDEVLSRAVRDLLTRIEQRPETIGGRHYMTRAEIQTAKVAGAVRPGQVDELITAWLAHFPLCITVYSERDKGKWPGARLADRTDCPLPARRGPAPVIVWEPRRRAAPRLTDHPDTDGKLLTSGVSRLPTDRSPDSGSAGQRLGGPTDPGPETPESGPVRRYPSGIPGGDDGQP